jgi:hypothetical protein
MQCKNVSADIVKDYRYTTLLTLVINCFLVMATKQKLLFVFFCCLLLTSITIPPAEAQLMRCLRSCGVFAMVVRRFCRTIRRPPALRRRCFAAVNRGLRRCRAMCRGRPAAGRQAAPTTQPITTRDPYGTTRDPYDI